MKIPGLLLLLVLPLLGSPQGATAWAQRPPAKEAALNRDAASKMVKAFMASLKIKSEGLNDKNLGGAETDAFTLYFEYLPEQKALKANALIYRFKKPPDPQLLAGFHKEEAAGTDTGGGKVEYQGENRGLFLSRTYTAPVDSDRFIKDMQRLLSASQVWGDEVLERVAERVFHPPS